MTSGPKTCRAVAGMWCVIILPFPIDCIHNTLSYFVDCISITLYQLLLTAYLVLYIRTVYSTQNLLYVRACVCVCACACVRACVGACMHVSLPTVCFTTIGMVCLRAIIRCMNWLHSIVWQTTPFLNDLLAWIGQITVKTLFQKCMSFIEMRQTYAEMDYFHNSVRSPYVNSSVGIASS